MITDDQGASPPARSTALKQNVVTLAGRNAPSLASLLARLDLDGVVTHHIMEQAGAPNSTVPHHGVALASLFEAWAPSEAAMARNAAILGREAPDAATFQIEPIAFL